jgi:hypothetical protein
MSGLFQISAHGQPAAFLLQSKVAPHGGPDQHVSEVEAPRQAARRHPAVLGRRDGAGAVVRLDRAVRGPDGARLRRGHGAQVVLCLSSKALRPPRPTRLPPLSKVSDWADGIISRAGRSRLTPGRSDRCWCRCTSCPRARCRRRRRPRCGRSPGWIRRTSSRQVRHRGGARRHHHMGDAGGLIAQSSRYVPWPSRTKPLPSKISTSLTSSPRWLR